VNDETVIGLSFGPSAIEALASGRASAIWDGVDNDATLAIVEFPVPFATPPVTSVRHVWIGQTIQLIRRPAGVRANGLLLFGMEPKDVTEDEFQGWYETEHLPRLTALAGVQSVRRLRSVQGSPRFYAVYELDEPGVCLSAAWEEAAITPWTIRMRARTTKRVRTLFRRRPG
jgi:hypothetical protein